MDDQKDETSKKSSLKKWAGTIKLIGDTIKALGVVGGLLFAIISFWPSARLYVEQLKTRDSFVYLGYLHGPDFNQFADVQFDNKVWNGTNLRSMAGLFGAGDDVTQYVGGQTIPLRSQPGGDASGPSRLADGQCVVVRGISFRPYVNSNHALGAVRVTTDGSLPAKSDWEAAASRVRSEAVHLCRSTPGQCKISVWGTVRRVSCI